MTQAYVYKLTHNPTYKWYIGVRFAKDCHINDGYYSSSKIVKSMYKNNPAEWSKTIIATGTTTEMRKLEKDLLTLSDAASDPRSFNKANGFPALGNDWSMRDQTGDRNVMRRPEVVKKYSIAKTGKPRPDMMGDNNPYHRNPELKENLSRQLKGRRQSKEHIRNRQKAMMAKQYTCPHCNLTSRNNGNMKRYHYDACKQKFFKSIVSV